MPEGRMATPRFGLICKQRAAPPRSNLSQEIPSILRQQDTEYFHPVFLSQRHQIGPERRKSTIRQRPAIVGNLHTFNPGTQFLPCLLYTSPSPRDGLLSRMPSSA